MTRDDLPHLVESALRNLGGAAPIVGVARKIWEQHEDSLRASGDIFFTRQYDMRWAAQKLRDAHKLAYERQNGKPVWRLLKST